MSTTPTPEHTDNTASAQGPMKTDSYRQWRADGVERQLADGPALLDLDDAIEILWHYQHRIAAWNGIGADDQDAQLFSLAKDAGIVAGLCHAIITGEDLFYRTGGEARTRAATGVAQAKPPVMGA